MTKPLLTEFKHTRGYVIWMARWRDKAGKQNSKSFGKVSDVGKKIAKARFDNWLQNEWAAKEHIKNPSGEIAAYKVRMLGADYKKYAVGIYQKNGRPTSHVFQVNLAMDAMSELYGEEPVDAMGAPEIAKVREHMIDSENQRGEPIKLTRKTVNGRLVIIKQSFSWARERGLISRNALVDIQIVKPLAFGRGKARESKAVLPVSLALVEQTLEVCTSVLRGMIEVQAFSGMRPGELVAMQPGLIDRSHEVWIYRVSDDVYKMAHMENAPKREVYLGPKAQGILSTFLHERRDDVYVFSPYESELERRAELSLSRRAPAGCGNKCESKQTGEFKRARFKRGSGYTTASYRKAIEYACKRAGMPKDWNPNQIRHSTATDLRKKYGIEAASVTLGQTSISTTEIYAEQDRDKAKEIARITG